jgi:hypothetical protein
MTYAEFRKTVEEMVDEIPPQFLEGLQGIHALEQARPEEDYEDVWRLGEYVDPGPDQFLGASVGFARHIALYYGSFLQVARGDDSFEWQEEIWDTLTHELQHHVESLAGDASLIGFDQEQARHFRRRD